MNLPELSRRSLKNLESRFRVPIQVGEPLLSRPLECPSWDSSRRIARLAWFKREYTANELEDWD